MPQKLQSPRRKAFLQCTAYLIMLAGGIVISALALILGVDSDEGKR